MKLAFISTILGYPWGGADVLWTRAAVRARADGHEVLVAVSPIVARHSRVAALQAQGATMHLRHGFTQRRGNRDIWRQAFARILRRGSSLTGALDAFQPDHVVISQGGVFDFLVEDGLVAWLEETGTPFTLVAQSNDERDTLSQADQARAQRVFASAHATIFVSTHNRDHAARQCGAPVPRALVVPNPVERAPASELDWPATDRAQIAVVARLESDAKGLDVLLNALAQIDSKDWHVDLYGSGRDETLLRTLAEALRLGARVTFAGFEADLQKIWSTHHLLVLASRREGCALAMLEALACGRPVLTTAVGGASDWIEPGVNGYVCPPGDVAALVDTMRTALAERSRWRAMGAAGRRRLLERLPDAPEDALLAAVGATQLQSCGRA